MTTTQRPPDERPHDGRPDAGGTTDDAGRRPPAELGMVALLLAIGVLLLVEAGSIAIPGSTNTLGPRFFPYLVGGLVVLVAVVLGTAVLRGDRAPSEDSEDVDSEAGTSWISVVVIAVAFAAHALLINVVGWPLAVTVMFALVCKALGASGWIRPFLAGGVTSVIVWIIFVKALGVALPGGTLLELVTGG